MTKEAGSEFILNNFEPEDRLATVLIDRGSGIVIQRIASAKQIASQEFQVWLKSENRAGRDVFISMNALASDARGRTRDDVEKIRHLYLDFDEDGTRALRALQGCEAMPKPNYVLNTSPDHWQVSWKVQNFGKEEAEAMMRELVREFGADPAATDCARVMRMPGFINHKRRPAHLIRAERLAEAIYTPESFPRFPQDDRLTTSSKGEPASIHARRHQKGHFSQSELDWAYAKRALARGESPAAVAAAIANYRRGEKSDPEYYAQLTVGKAKASLGNSQDAIGDPVPER